MISLCYVHQGHNLFDGHGFVRVDRESRVFLCLQQFYQCVLYLREGQGSLFSVDVVSELIVLVPVLH